MLDPLVTGALITGGASLLGNALGFGSNASANSTNLQIARENNAAQMGMMKSQQAYNEMMWNKQNEYNLPKAQVQRLLDAGINPSAVFGSGSVSEAGQLTAPQLPNLQQAHVNPFTPDMTGVGNAVNAYFANQSILKDVESKGIDNQAKQIDLQFKYADTLLRMQERRANLQESLSRKDLNMSQREYIQSQIRDLNNHIHLFEDNFEVLSRREKLQNDVMENQSNVLIADSTLKRAQASYQQALLNAFPDMNRAQLNLLNAQFNDLVQSAQLKAKEGELTSSKAISQYLENGLKAYDYSKVKSKYEVRDSSKIVRGVQAALDIIGETIFGNIKLFGK